MTHFSIVNEAQVQVLLYFNGSFSQSLQDVLYTVFFGIRQYTVKFTPLKNLIKEKVTTCTKNPSSLNWNWGLSMWHFYTTPQNFKEPGLNHWLHLNNILSLPSRANTDSMLCPGGFLVNLEAESKDSAVPKDAMPASTRTPVQPLSFSRELGTSVQPPLCVAPQTWQICPCQTTSGTFLNI